MDAPLGLEPRLTDSKSALLPLEEGAKITRRVRTRLAVVNQLTRLIV